MWTGRKGFVAGLLQGSEGIIIPDIITANYSSCGHGFDRDREVKYMRCIVVLLLTGWALACGGTDKGTAPGDTGLPFNDGEPEEGRVMLDNQTIYAVETAYLNRVDEERPRIVRVQVEPGQTRDVSREVLPPGLKVELDLVLLLPAEMGFRVRHKAEVYIDGDVVLHLLLEDKDDPFSLRID